MRGSMTRGMPSSFRISSSQSSVSRFIKSVREALVTSVTCSPVKFQISQESMVPNSRSPLSAFFRAPDTFSKIHLIFGPEKYVASGSPVFARRRSCPPCFASALQISSVRVSCQTMALWIGLPVRLSQTTVVSRWLVTPTATICSGTMRPRSSAVVITASIRSQI
ncbi:MAG: hypothetical protein PGMFKBFP_00150 [Anaerolineales bacterium]|nr:hypothetical protein [Anaerolineales bacterium]